MAAIELGYKIEVLFRQPLLLAAKRYKQIALRYKPTAQCNQLITRAKKKFKPFLAHALCTLSILLHSLGIQKKIVH